MQAKRRYASALLLLWLGGCGPVTLEEMKAPVLRLAVSPALPIGTGEVVITLAEGGDDCPDLSSEARAHVNDVEVPLLSAGTWSRGGFLGPSAHCAPTLFRAESGFPITQGEDVIRVRISEGTTRLEAEVQDLCRPRSFSLRAPEVGVLRSGDEVDLEWLPATDTLLVTSVTLRTGDSSREVARLDLGTLRVEGNHLRFRMPQLDIREEGVATLFLSNGEADLHRPQVTRCEGLTRCDFVCSFPDVQWLLAVFLRPG